MRGAVDQPDTSEAPEVDEGVSGIGGVGAGRIGAEEKLPVFGRPDGFGGLGGLVVGCFVVVDIPPAGHAEVEEGMWRAGHDEPTEGDQRVRSYEDHLWETSGTWDVEEVA